jgi:hypothetical protein
MGWPLEGTISVESPVALIRAQKLALDFASGGHPCAAAGMVAAAGVVDHLVGLGQGRPARKVIALV